MIFYASDQTLDEFSLIQAARKDPHEFGKLYNLYVNRVYHYLFNRLGNSQDAEDVTSQTFIAAFEAFSRFHQDAHFVSWIFTIARNKATDHYRKSKILPITVEDPELLDAKIPSVEAFASEQTGAIYDLIRKLNEEEQELLRLRFVARMSFSEMAHLLHRSEQAVKKATYRILARLRSQLEVTNE